MAEDANTIALTHLQARRLRQLDQLDKREFGSGYLTSHWSSSKAANEKLCLLGLAERVGQTFYQPSGKPAYVGEAKITDAGRAWVLAHA